MLDNILDGGRPSYNYNCEFYVHYIGNETCQAFPEGIPLGIWVAAQAPDVCNKDKNISWIPK